MKILLTSTVLNLIADKAIDEKQDIQRCVNTTLLNYFKESQDCPHKKVTDCLKNWLENVIKATHATEKHEPEYIVVLHKLNTLIREMK